MLSEGQLRYPHVVALARDMPWALLPSKLAEIRDLIRLRSEGARLTPEEIATRIGAARSETRPTGGAVAVIPVFGTIVQRADMFTDMSGGTSTERLTAAIRQAVADPSVGAIVLQVDSPGGGVYGVTELADTIYRARGSKPIVAVADSMAASAAYWIAASADEISVTPSSQVGSIGVFAAHEDLSRLLDAEGVAVTLVSAGKFKTEGNPFEPLGEEARAAIQSRVDDYYGMFVRAVARGRGVSVETVRSGFGQGRMVGSAEAVKLGMADRVETLEATIARLSKPRRSDGGRQADDLSPDLMTELPTDPPEALTVGLAGDPDWRRRRLRLRQH